MKRTILISMLFILTTAIPFVNTSCSKDNNPSPSKTDLLCKTWVSPKLSGGYHDEITFKKDGSVIFYGVKDDGTLFDASTSTWKWGDSNETTLIENNGKNTWAYTVIKLTDKELVLKSNIEGTNISWTAK